MTLSIPKDDDHILVPVDYSESSKKALKHAIALASATGCKRLDVLFSWPVPYLVDDAQAPANRDEANLLERIRLAATDEMREFLDDDTLNHSGIQLTTHIVCGEPKIAILDHARDTKPALIVVGTHGRSALPRWFLGSVAEYVVRRAECPVMIVPQDAN